MGLKRFLSLALVLAFTLAMIQCKKKEEPAATPTSTVTTTVTMPTTNTTTDLVVAGQLSVTRSNRANESSYKVYCVTFTVPTKSGNSTVGSDGKFALNLEGGKEKPFGCFILDSNDNVKATMAIKDTTQSSMGSSTDSAKTGQASFTENAYLGTVTVDTVTGSAEVDKSQIKKMDTSGNVYTTQATATATTSTTQTEPYDFTGTWQFADLASSDLPLGYTALPQNNGPTAGMNIFIKRLWGWKYSNGTTSTTEKVYGIQVWETEAGAKICSGGTDIPLGFTITEAKTNGGVDFTGTLSSQNLTDNPVQWATGWTDGWKAIPATAQWSIWKETSTDQWDEVVPSGTSCSAISDTYAKEKVQCYLNWYSQYARDVNITTLGGCIKNLDVDWSKMNNNSLTYSTEAEAISALIRNNGPEKPTNLFVFEKILYSTPNSASFMMNESHYGNDCYYHEVDSSGNQSSSLTGHVFRYSGSNGSNDPVYAAIAQVEQTSGNSLLSYNGKYYKHEHTNCEINSAMKMSFTKIENTTPAEMLGEWIENTSLNAISTDENYNVCNAAVTASPKNLHVDALGTSKYMYKMIKQ